MPPTYPDLADELLADNPDLTIAEAYWQAACQLADAVQPSTATNIRTVQLVSGSMVSWQQDGVRRRRRFADDEDALAFEAQLASGRVDRA